MAFAGAATKHKGMRKLMRLLAMITAMAMILSMNPVIGLSLNGETPAIDKINPSTGIVGTTVEITGTDFGTTAGQVTFPNNIEVIPTRYEENDTTAQWEFSDTTSWTNVAVTNASGGHQKQSKLASSYVGLVFAGSRVAWIASKGPSYGSAEVYIDRVLVGTVNLNSDTNTYRQEVFVKTGLSNTNHTLRIVVLEEGKYVNIDAIDVGGLMSRQDVVWNDTSITVQVPAGAATGGVTVTTSVDATSNTIPFEVIKTPAITGVSPEYGVAGTHVTIIGSNFGSYKSAVGGTVTLSGTPVPTTSWTPTSIGFDAPASAGVKDVVVRNNAGSSNVKQFEIYGVPTITGFTPTSGLVGQEITITGTNFGSQRQQPVVKIGTEVCEVTSWTDTQIAAKIPTGASTGNITVMTLGGTATGSIFTLIPPPRIDSLSKTRAQWNDIILIKGNHFGQTVNDAQVYIGTKLVPDKIEDDAGFIDYRGIWGGASWPILSGGHHSYSNDYNTPASASLKFIGTHVSWVAFKYPNRGIVDVYIDDVKKSSIDLFSSTLQPQVVAFDAANLANEVHIIRIEPTNKKSASSTDYYASIDRLDASLVGFWTDNEASLVVPYGMSTGNVKIVTGAGSSNGTELIITNPLIEAMSPTSALTGSTVTITGSNFGATQLAVGGKLFLAGVEITPTSWSDTAISFKTPTGATTGGVCVTTDGTDPDHNGSSNTKALAVTPPPPPPVITSAVGLDGALKGGPGQLVTLRGQNFGTTFGKVTFNGENAVPTRYEDNRGDAGYLFSGAWSQVNNQFFSGGTFNRTDIANAQVTFPFTGTRVVWLAAKGKEFGIAKVYIDGVAKGTVDLFEAINSGYKYQEPVFKATGLKNGAHTIRIEATGTKNTDKLATGTSINFDAFDVGGGSLMKDIVWTNTAVAVYVPDTASDGPIEITVEGGSDIYKVNGQVANFDFIPPPASSTGGGGGTSGGGTSGGTTTGGTTTITTITTSDKGTIHGFVLTTAHRPIPGTVIRAHNNGGGDYVVPSNAGGEFRVSVPIGIYTMYYDAPGYVGQIQQAIVVNKDKETTVPTVLLSASGSVSIAGTGLGEIGGFVLNTAHQPIPGTCIRINNILMPTNPGGEFRFTLVHPGAYNIYYDAPGYVGQVQENITVVAGQRTTTPTCLLSTSGGEIYGKVVNHLGQPIPGTCIRINNSIMPTNAGGEFRFTRVANGRYTIYYDAPGYVGQIQEGITVNGGVTRPPMVILQPSGSAAAAPGTGQIRGFVWDTSHRGIPGTAVRINASVIPTIPSGEFRFSNVYPGTYKIYYDAPGHVGQTQEGIRVQSGVITITPTVILNH